MWVLDDLARRCYCRTNDSSLRVCSGVELADGYYRAPGRMKEGNMTLARYYSELLLRRREETAPTLEEAQQDYQRAVELTNVALGFVV